MDSAIDGYFVDFKAVLENTKKCAARTNAMEREGDDLVTRLTKLLAILLVLILSFHQVIAAEAAGPFSKDALSIPSLDENTAIYAGTWVADSEEQAFLLLGNEKVMWLAVATQMEDGAYQLIAQSKPVLSYEKYCLGSVEMMDKWDDGRPYFWYLWVCQTYWTEKKEMAFLEAERLNGIQEVSGSIPLVSTIGSARYS